MDKDMFSSDIIGYVNINLEEVYLTMSVKKAYNVVYEGMFAGELTVKLTFQQ
jgi:hypothetical protein